MGYINKLCDKRKICMCVLMLSVIIVSREYIFAEEQSQLVEFKNTFVHCELECDFSLFGKDKAEAETVWSGVPRWNLDYEVRWKSVKLPMYSHKLGVII